jgi:RNA recognition motif-containing protein
VANLPFSVDEAGLTKIFEGYSPVKAHVVKKRNGRSKGFGFVEFANEGDQVKAQAEINGKSVEGRELIVKIALTETKVEGEANANANSNANAAPKAADKKEEEKSEEKKE